jgi:hypothetical protein
MGEIPTLEALEINRKMHPPSEEYAGQLLADLEWSYTEKV